MMHRQKNIKLEDF